MAQSFNTNLNKVAVSYLRLLKARVTASTLIEQLEQNPHYPTLLSLSDTLERFYIANRAYRIDPEAAMALEAPFIAFMSNQGTGKDFVLVTEINGESVRYVSDGPRPKTINAGKFRKDFLGVVFYAETNDQSGESDYSARVKREKIKRMRKALWVMAVFAPVMAASCYNVSHLRSTSLVFWGGMAILKSIGLAATLALLTYSINKNNTLVKNICTRGFKANCDAVLNSKASKLMGVNWAEMGFFYFASTFIWLLTPTSFSLRLACLAIANGLVAPYILFSVYYQWRVVKQWCLLCLVVQAVLASELAWSILFYWQKASLPTLSPPAIGVLLSCVLLPIGAWYGLKPLFSASLEAGIYKAAYTRLQHNPDVFNGLLQSQAEAPLDNPQLGIWIGSLSAKVIIIKVCNPYCGPCAKAHGILEELLHSKDVQIRILFNCTNDPRDRAGEVARHLLTIAAAGDESVTRRALNDWYSDKRKDYREFARKWNIDGVTFNPKPAIDQMVHWCGAAGISHTPTIFINGRQIPEMYHLNQLKYLLS